MSSTVARLALLGFGDAEPGRSPIEAWVARMRAVTGWHGEYNSWLWRLLWQGATKAGPPPALVLGG